MYIITVITKKHNNKHNNNQEACSHTDSLKSQPTPTDSKIVFTRTPITIMIMKTQNLEGFN